MKTVCAGKGHLSWRNRLGGLDVVSSPAVVPATAISGGDDGPQLMAPGIPVETDPFADPFGDRQLSAVPPATRQADLVAPLEVPGEQVASPIEETLDAGQQAPLRLEAIPLRAAQAAPAGPGSPDSNRNHETSAQELGSALQVPGSRQSQQPPSTPMPRTPASERHIYNERDCDRDVADCQRLRDRVRARSIRQISLDISPSFNPVTLESGEAPPERPRGYVNDYRTWTDAQGRVVAVGALQGIEHGRLLIRTREGKIEQIPYRELSDVDQCYFAAWWGIPSECTLGYERYEPRQPVPATFAWKASAVYHKPLYFEEVQLERYGHSARPLIQTALSGAHFVGNIATLPYQMAIHPMWECQYPLGHYRPGNCAPWLVPPVPVSAKGGLAEAGVILGGVFLVP
ncbi:MAG: hypothetical protein KatS3mg110_1797 [Pirellulaceae bacterium]|nr:MAG: hypothetical protein KatS3mg110_1797 [Pirellulaceae bacterium]